MACYHVAMCLLFLFLATASGESQSCAVDDSCSDIFEGPAPGSAQVQIHTGRLDVSSIANKIQHKIVMADDCKMKGAQIAIMLDCTGSMGDFLDEVKASIVTFATDVHAFVEGDLELAFLCFKDTERQGGSGPHITPRPEGNVYGFIWAGTYNSETETGGTPKWYSDPSTLQTDIDTHAAVGGGDVPEDVVGALKHTFETLDWNPDASKLLLMITQDIDAGRSGDADAQCALMKQIKAADINLMFTHIKADTQDLAAHWKSCYDDTPYYEMDEIDMTDRDTSKLGLRTVETLLNRTEIQCTVPKPTLAPTPAPTEPCEDGKCTIWGDPHITSFDKVDQSLLEIGGKHWRPQSDLEGSFDVGDFWLVKSSPLRIQGRFRKVSATGSSHKLPYLTSIAVGGPLIGGNTLIIEGREGNVLWNGGKILQDFPGLFEIKGLMTAKYHNNRLVSDHTKKSKGLDLIFAKGVNMTVNRWHKKLGVEIGMPPLPGGQDGQCGNFNGNPSDDSLELIEKRGASSVLADELLFNRH